MFSPISKRSVIVYAALALGIATSTNARSMRKSTNPYIASELEEMVYRSLSANRTGP